jgi:hypothetical protein
MADTLPLRELAQLVEFGEANAYVDLFAAAPPDWGFIVERVGSAVLLLAAQAPILLFNRVIGLGLQEPATEDMVGRIAARYREAGLRQFGVQLSPAADPPELASWLQARQLTRQDRWAKVFRRPDTSAVVPTDLRIECIDERSAATFAQVARVGFGMPEALQPWLASSVGRAGWRHYVAFDDERAVASGALYVHGQIGWLGIASTLPSHRRRGAQGAIMARRIHDAAEAGCTWLVTETGEDTSAQPNPSFHNMIRTGFTLAYHRPNYLGRASAN